ncbi:MAG: hypothetical protein AB200_03030 [Parcubacteria bacterium C7867-005]|nr:MAG: hypothetical protein AB200_03030 [Parcubacteria bacterium C7867-005]
MRDYKELIFELENKLQHPEVRKSVQELDGLISNDLIEFGSSGQVYTKKDVLVNLPSSTEIKFNMTDFDVIALGPDIVQSRFKTEKTNLQTGEITRSQRSSLWRNENGKWKMIFHQGTPTK